MLHKRIPVVITIFSILTVIFLMAPETSYACHVGTRHNAPLETCGSSGDTTASGAIIIHNSTGCFGDGVPHDLPIGTSAQVNGWRMPRNGAIQNMRVAIGRNTANATVTVAIHIDGSTTTLTTDITAGSTANVDIDDTVDVFDGERISVVTSGPSCSGVIDLSVSYGIQ